MGCQCSPLADAGGCRLCLSESATGVGGIGIVSGVRSFSQLFSLFWIFYSKNSALCVAPRLNNNKKNDWNAWLFQAFT